MTGWNPQQLVNRGVFSSLEEADAILCRWDEARARSVITPDSWRRGMALDVPISRRRMASGVSVLGSPESFPASECGAGAGVVASSSRRPAPAPSLCPWCALERAYQGHGAAPRAGFVAVERCSRHAGSSAPAVQSSPMPHNSPAVAPASHLAAAAGFLNPNPNAGVVQAFPKGRWS